MGAAEAEPCTHTHPPPHCPPSSEALLMLKGEMQSGSPGLTIRNQHGKERERKNVITEREIPLLKLQNQAMTQNLVQRIYSDELMQFNLCRGLFVPYAASLCLFVIYLGELVARLDFPKGIH